MTILKIDDTNHSQYALKLFNMENGQLEMKLPLTIFNNQCVLVYVAVATFLTFSPGRKPGVGVTT